MIVNQIIDVTLVALAFIVQHVQSKRRDDDIEAFLRTVSWKLEKVDASCFKSDAFAGKSVGTRSFEALLDTQAKQQILIGRLAKAAGFEFKVVPSVPAKPEEVVVVKAK